MPIVTHVYWRDIPAQVIVGKGRRGAKAPLPERFEQAIDRVAMKIGARDEDAYLREWRRVEMGEREGEPSDIAAPRPRASTRFRRGRAEDPDRRRRVRPRGARAL
jgi:hypothetical protein